MQEQGWSAAQVRKALREARADDFTFSDGEILGSMCTAPHDIGREAHDLFLETNLGDPAHFPGAARLEREVLEDLLQLLGAPRGAEGRFLSGGTEANILACYLARERTGRREVVLPESAHFSFAKAARMLGMTLRHVPTRADGKADLPAMQGAVGKDTALMVLVAGTTELGLVDPIEEGALWCSRNDVLLHVDAAFGGYILPFLEDASRLPHRFDFRLPGVWSLAIDPHKMGMAPIPAGALLLRDGRDWSRIAVESPYVSTEAQSSILGTRPGAPAAAAWAVHRHLGRLGFASVVETCLDNTTYLAAKLQAKGVELVQSPELNVVAFRDDDPDRLSQRLAEEGFRVNVIPRLSALRIVVNPHLRRSHIDAFLGALDRVLE